MFQTKKKRRDPNQTQLMSLKMQDVIQRYVSRYQEHDGYYKVSSENVTRSIQTIVTPIMMSILQKYNETDFHNVMKKRYRDEDGFLCWGFDYIGDMKRNHPWAWNVAMMIIRANKKKLNINVNVAAELMIDIMYSWGWRVWPHEKQAVHHMLYRVKRLIETA